MKAAGPEDFYRDPRAYQRRHAGTAPAPSAPARADRYRSPWPAWLRPVLVVLFGRAWVRQCRDLDEFFRVADLVRQVLPMQATLSADMYPDGSLIVALTLIPSEIRAIESVLD
jgi:hypothetical protein